jgi:uncharacterized protein YndB with AHSA1/START domain
MTARTVTHATFRIERVFAATPARTFKAFADPAAKVKWFTVPRDKATQLLRESDFRVGGTDRFSAKWTGGPTSHFVAHYLDIVPNERIIYAYEMHLDDRKISDSLATVEFKVDDAGTRFTLTEQGAYLDGWDNPATREQGTQSLVEALKASLAT